MDNNDKINFKYTHVKFFRDVKEVDGEKIQMLFKYWFNGKERMAVERLDPKEHLTKMK